MINIAIGTATTPTPARRRELAHLPRAAAFHEGRGDRLVFAVCALVFAATPCASTLLRFSWVRHNGYDETDSFHGSEGCRGFDTAEACFRTFKRAPFVCSPQPINREYDNVLRFVYVVLLYPFCRCLRPELHKTATLGSQYNEMVQPFACGLRGVFCCLFKFNNTKDPYDRP